MENGSAKEYALIIIGGGICGLSAAITWARNNDINKRSVLLLEKEPKTGGFVTSYERMGYLFDTCQMIPNMSDVFQYLGIEVELRAFKGYYMRIFLVDPKTGDLKKILNIPSGFETFKNWIIETYPHEESQVERLLNHSRAMYEELFRLKIAPKFIDILKIITTCPKLFRNSSKTFAEYYKQFGIQENEIREIFGVFAAFSALPEGRVSAVVPTSAMNSLLDGAYRPKEGFIGFSEAFENRARSLGVEIIKNCSVSKIIQEKGQVKGVKLLSGEEILAENVITTIDPKVAMEELVGIDIIVQMDKKYAEKVKKVRMSTSSINISLGLGETIDLEALGLDCGYNVVTTGGDTFNRLFDEYEMGRMGFSKSCFHIGVICPSLTTGGKPSITIRVVPVPAARWIELREKDRPKYKAEKERWGEFFIRLAEQYVIPDLRKHIVVKDISTPATYARFSGSPTGSIYDMAPYPDNFGRTRLKLRTPIKGLYQPKFVHGVFGAALGGMQAVDMILEGRVMGGYARYSPTKMG